MPAITRSATPLSSFPVAKVVEEEEGFRALHDQVVDAHRDQVDAHRVVPIVVNRQLQLGPHAIVGSHQQRIGVAGGARIEEAAKAADLAISARTPRGLDQRPDGLDQRIAGINRNAGVGVGVGRCICTHAEPAISFRAWISTHHWAKDRRFPRWPVFPSLPACSQAAC
jgi:hypothetical protein